MISWAEKPGTLRLNLDLPNCEITNECWFKVAEQAGIEMNSDRAWWHKRLALWEGPYHTGPWRQWQKTLCSLSWKRRMRSHRRDEDDNDTIRICFFGAFLFSRYSFPRLPNEHSKGLGGCRERRAVPRPTLIIKAYWKERMGKTRKRTGGGINIIFLGLTPSLGTILKHFLI